jgi:hypothetical protein
VTTDRDAYPDFEVVQYRRNSDPRFLAKDGSSRVGPGAMVPPYPNSRKTWIDGHIQ